MKQRSFYTWLAVTLVIMLALPGAVARFAPECSGMALCMMLFLIINPVYSAMLGLMCGRDTRQMWYIPAVSSVAFLAGTWLWFDIREPWFVIYAAVYLIIGYSAMGVSRFLATKR